MKEKELRKYTLCANCHTDICSSGLPLFWRVKIERFGIDMNAVRRQDGLTAFLGGQSLLAQVVGPDEEMTQDMLKPVTVAICDACAMKPDLCLAVLAFLKE